MLVILNSRFYDFCFKAQSLFLRDDTKHDLHLCNPFVVHLFNYLFTVTNDFCSSEGNFNLNEMLLGWLILTLSDFSFINPQYEGGHPRGRTHPLESNIKFFKEGLMTNKKK